MTLRSFRGVPVQKLETFYLPKKLVIFRVGPVKRNTMYIHPALDDNISCVPRK